MEILQDHTKPTSQTTAAKHTSSLTQLKKHSSPSSMEESRLVYPRNKSLSQPPSRRPEPTETGLTSLAAATHQAITWSKTSMIVADIQLEKLVNLSNNKSLSKEKEEAPTPTKSFKRPAASDIDPQPNENNMDLLRDDNEDDNLTQPIPKQTPPHYSVAQIPLHFTLGYSSLCVLSWS